MNNLTEEDLRKLATAAADESIKRMFAIIGVDTGDLEDLKRMQANLAWADRSRKLSDKLGGRIFLTVASVLTGAALLAAWETLKLKLGSS